MGHPWPGAANPASCRVAHASESAFGQRGLTGRLRSKSKADQKQRELLGYVGVVGGYDGADRGIPDTTLRSLRQLLQKIGKFTNKVGCQAAALLRGAPLNHAGRNSILLRGVNRQGCRFSRLRPWMAGGGGATQQYRITGMPSDSEVPSGGARAFCLLLGSKVRRRKGATPKQPLPQQRICTQKRIYTTKLMYQPRYIPDTPPTPPHATLSPRLPAK